jgi:hypothetical protein
VVTIAGEDLLVIRHGDWAVVMDPDERDRLEQLREAQPSPPSRLAAWSTWIDRQDAAIILLPSGLRAFRSYATRQKQQGPAQNVVPADASDNPFGEPVRPTMPAGDDAWSAFDESLRKLLTDMPEIGNWLAEAEGAGCGLRIDAAGSAVIDLRLACAREALPPENVEATRPVPRLYDGGDFVIAGSGQVSPGWVVPAVAPYVRQRINDLAVQFGTKFDDAEVAKFRTEIEQAVADVRAFAVLTRPGKESEGVFTNNFLALRVKSPQAFLERADLAIQRWNSMFESAQGEIRLVFKSRAITVAKRKGTEYSIDMATAVGAPALPEIKPSMEKLFGPGGEFRLQFVALDDDTVLLAAANETQVAHVIESFGKATIEATERSELRDAEVLLAKPSDWRIYVSPHGYNESLKRQMEAILGPVIGGPVVPDFPASPPVGVAGGVEGNVVWTELALPAETIRGIGAYLHQ